ncbi:hypothetical protein BCV69DRAFT_315310 [Microstroma glucosiphilum]|uniref:Uncharacterized protein n=1 Tax=Pseudomicrostroma glucosiphilum TaxID=1684307 RepID=A0A316U420_9BASI|nr:hypothetical protein BCV69DRAFT_315310 [Pseudomicrostroma glucosiphilum]PWN17665.1 hypothetical protein BCV69DRAFT_315310 [Pseudomicrostroma glucosiphilum]
MQRQHHYQPQQPHLPTTNTPLRQAQPHTPLPSATIHHHSAALPSSSPPHSLALALPLPQPAYRSLPSSSSTSPPLSNPKPSNPRRLPSSSSTACSPPPRPRIRKRWLPAPSPPPPPPPVPASAATGSRLVLPALFETRQGAELWARVYIGGEERDLATRLAIVHRPRAGAITKGATEEEAAQVPQTTLTSSGGRGKAKASARKRDPDKPWLVRAGDNNRPGDLVLQCTSHKCTGCKWKLVISQHLKDAEVASLFPTTSAQATATIAASASAPSSSSGPSSSSSSSSPYYYSLSNPIQSHSLLCIRGPLYAQFLPKFRSWLAAQETPASSAKEEKAWLKNFAARWCKEERKRREREGEGRGEDMDMHTAEPQEALGQQEGDQLEDEDASFSDYQLPLQEDQDHNDQHDENDDCDFFADLDVDEPLPMANANGGSDSDRGQAGHLASSRALSDHREESIDDFTSASSDLTGASHKHSTSPHAAQNLDEDLTEATPTSLGLGRSRARDTWSAAATSTSPPCSDAYAPALPAATTSRARSISTSVSTSSSTSLSTSRFTGPMSTSAISPSTSIRTSYSLSSSTSATGAGRGKDQSTASCPSTRRRSPTPIPIIPLPLPTYPARTLPAPSPPPGESEPQTLRFWWASEPSKTLCAALEPHVPGVTEWVRERMQVQYHSRMRGSVQGGGGRGESTSSERGKDKALLRRCESAGWAQRGETHRRDTGIARSDVLDLLGLVRTVDELMTRSPWALRSAEGTEALCEGERVRERREAATAATGTSTFSSTFFTGPAPATWTSSSTTPSATLEPTPGTSVAALKSLPHLPSIIIHVPSVGEAPSFSSDSSSSSSSGTSTSEDESDSESRSNGTTEDAEGFSSAGSAISSASSTATATARGSAAGNSASLWPQGVLLIWPSPKESRVQSSWEFLKRMGRKEKGKGKEKDMAQKSKKQSRTSRSEEHLAANTKATTREAPLDAQERASAAPSSSTASPSTATSSLPSSSSPVRPQEQASEDLPATPPSVLVFSSKLLFFYPSLESLQLRHGLLLPVGDGNGPEEEKEREKRRKRGQEAEPDKQQERSWGSWTVENRQGQQEAALVQKSMLPTVGLASSGGSGEEPSPPFYPITTPAATIRAAAAATSDSISTLTSNTKFSSSDGPQVAATRAFTEQSHAQSQARARAEATGQAFDSLQAPKASTVTRTSRRSQPRSRLRSRAESGPKPVTPSIAQLHALVPCTLAELKERLSPSGLPSQKYERSTSAAAAPRSAARNLDRAPFSHCLHCWEPSASSLRRLLEEMPELRSAWGVSVGGWEVQRDADAHQDEAEAREPGGESTTKGGERGGRKRRKEMHRAGFGMRRRKKRRLGG